MITFKEIYEARVVDVAQRKKAAIRMKKLAQSSAFQKKKERAAMKVRSNAQLYVAARKTAIKKLRTKKYPKYNWHKNFGYGTWKHLGALKKFGVTHFHRKSYRPVYNILSK